MKSNIESINERTTAVAQRAIDVGMSSIEFTHLVDLGLVDLGHRKCTSVDGLLDYLDARISEWVVTKKSS
jgi:hypothetical protein